MKLANVARVFVVAAACVAAGASATSTTNSDVTNAQQPNNQPPPPQQMDPARALGLWHSTFGGVKIEADLSRGGLQTGDVQGVWVYDRRGEEVIGYFSGHLRGNVLQFKWQEPANPPLIGEGYLVFDPQGRQYSGRWWSENHDRVGEWNGSRQGFQQGGEPAVQRGYPGQGQQGQQPQRQGQGQPYGADDGAYDQPTRQPAPQPRQPAPQPQPQPQPNQPTYY